MNIKTKHSRPVRHCVMAASLIVLGGLLSACESNKLLDVGSLWSPNEKKVASVAADGTATQATGEKIADASSEVTVGEGEDSIVLRGPENETTTASRVASSSTSDFPSLGNQPAKPTNLLNAGEESREISELKSTGENHVETRAAELNADAFVAEDIDDNKIAVKKNENSLFNLSFLNSEKPKQSVNALTPPEKLRLARANNIRPDASGAEDSVATGDAPAALPGLTATPEAPVAQTQRIAPIAKAAAVPRGVAKSAVVRTASLGNRPSVIKPQRIFFSSGAKTLTSSQQKSLDDLIKLGVRSNTKVFVLGFAGLDASASQAENKANRDLAIARAKYVAVGLRSRGVPGKQLAVQVVDEDIQNEPKTGAARRRVEVYFDEGTTLRNSVTQ